MKLSPESLARATSRHPWRTLIGWVLALVTAAVLRPRSWATPSPPTPTSRTIPSPSGPRPAGSSGLRAPDGGHGVRRGDVGRRGHRAGVPRRTSATSRPTIAALGAGRRPSRRQLPDRRRTGLGDRAVDAAAGARGRRRPHRRRSSTPSWLSRRWKASTPLMASRRMVAGPATLENDFIRLAEEGLQQGETHRPGGGAGRAGVRVRSGRRRV